MAKQMAQYKIVGDGTGNGIQIAGAGAYTKDSSSMFMPGQILNTRPDFEPRASMWPMNKAAEEAFAKLREKTAKVWRECLKNGTDPEGKLLQNVELPLKAEDIERRVKEIVRKVGPRRPAAEVKLRGRGKRIAPGTIFARDDQQAPVRDELDDSLDPGDSMAGARASDAE